MNLSARKILTDRLAMNAKIYDDTLADDASHPDVVAARAAGVAWAEREASAIEGTPEGSWICSVSDALPLVEFDPNSDAPDQFEREQELAAICNDAAADRWDEMCEEVAEVQS